ncbi:unnamed protein product [Allacma fusca]|uniref:Angiotensin-converting enzyme n=1 Tax=Allacma fusca TaxID=39272 RepID=A0A8J2LVN0_9HEXA|nr:unnamed protein product [Allacma fusca]
MTVFFNKVLLVLPFVVIFAQVSVQRELNGKYTQEDAIDYLQSLESEYSRECNKQMTARWKYIVDVTPENEKESTRVTNVFLQYQSSVQQEIMSRYSNWPSFPNATVKRELKYLAIKGPATMEPFKVAEMNELSSHMESVYATATVCEYNDTQKCNLRLEPEIEQKLTSVTDYDELAHYWTAWHNVMGKAVTASNYTKFIVFQNEMARANNFTDMSQMWLEPYNDGSKGWAASNFKTEMIETWAKLKPMYRKLHAYVRMKLRKSYGRAPVYEGKIKKYGYIPAHLLGNMWAQDWSALDARTKPYADTPSLDATAALVQQNYTVLRIFQEADKFFQGLGLPPMTETFWKESMLERPKDREVVCHASAEDFCLGKGSEDFRIKMCTEVNMEDLITVHHEMGHIAYFMQYTDHHYAFRDGANPGFHEAIGDALALAVTTPKHLQCVLVTKTDINFLYLMALQKIAFFPFAISMDQWRWEVFGGTLKEEDYTRRWWELRKENQGIIPPEERHSSFDPAAKYHIVANVPYIRYFVSHILQFQFYEAMCVEAGEYRPNDPKSKPLYQCDFAGNKAAGKRLSNMMKLGFSKPWPEALEAITGSREMSIEPLLNYFTPLIQFFDEELAAAGESDCFGRDCQAVASEYINGHYEREASGYDNQGDFWLRQYESDTFRDEVTTLWETVRPLYEELYAYVRFRLRKTYPQIGASSPLPAHILGNMWAQSWENVYDKVLPYEGFPSFDITAALKEKFKPDLQGVRGMFWVADDFFVSTGLANVSMAYGDRAMVIKPENKSAVCHASAWDFCDKEDFRIKMCTNVDMEDFITIHHELGHIQYYIQYKDLPITLREGANPGFHEAIGDVIALSVATPKHMQKIGFLNATTPSDESTVNYLMKMALDKVAFLPFGFLIDSYRWKIFDGSITNGSYTYEWLKMRATFQGVVPPVARSEQDFDAGAKYHVPDDTPYVAYFVSYILQFQLHKVLCETAGELKKNPLYECDIYGNAAAGLKLKKILQSGSSKMWKDLLKEITGSPDLDATALLEYFQPLRKYLEDERQTHDYPLGWDATAFEDFYESNRHL